MRLPVGTSFHLLDTLVFRDAFQKNIVAMIRPRSESQEVRGFGSIPMLSINWHVNCLIHQSKHFQFAHVALRQHANRFSLYVWTVMNFRTSFVIFSLLLFGQSTVAWSGPLPGAIFTTLEDGTRVNANIYDQKEDVYLDGGPGPNAPPTAAGLPDGNYYFQVTDPSGKQLLSEDPVKCREIRVAGGIIVEVITATHLKKVKGKYVLVDCTHNQGLDVDYGAVTVQLMPYKNTPNKGGVYKVWITPVDRFVGDVDSVDNPDYFHGFIPAWSKTDNYKVIKKGKPFDPPVLTIAKFHDENVNCQLDAGSGEAMISGWEITVTDPLGVSNTLFTPATIYTTEDGLWTITEAQPADTLQTVGFLDGVQESCYPTAEASIELLVAGDSGETHDVLFGNVGLGEVLACKFYDRNGNGLEEEDEPAVSGWPMQLTGIDVTGAAVGPVLQYTGDDGCTSFAGLLPGIYLVEELTAGTGDPLVSWIATTDTSVEILIDSELSGSELSGTLAVASFGNVCVGTADFDTKGYWHNKNGLTEITNDDIAYVNSLLPYSGPSDYFDDGDEPFDGKTQAGDDVQPALGGAGELIAPAGTPKAEISQFLVDPNAGGDPREQLAQQLLAFVFNTRHRLDSQDAVIELPNGDLISASELIDQAILDWFDGSAAEQDATKTVLDTLNNNDQVVYLLFAPCDVVP